MEKGFWFMGFYVYGVYFVYGGYVERLGGWEMVMMRGCNLVVLFCVWIYVWMKFKLFIDVMMVVGVVGRFMEFR